MVLRPILMGDYLIVGDGEEWSLKPGTVYALLKRHSKKIHASVSIRDLRLAQFVKSTGHISQTSDAPEEIAA